MAALTAIALAVAVGTTVYSFVEAEEQNKAQAAAERDAKKYMQDARRRLDVNYYKSLSINKEPYELERAGLAAAGAQAMEASKEGDPRGVAATAGRVQMAQNEAQAGIRTSQVKEQNYLDLLVANEESRLRDINTQLDLEEVAGAQLAAAQAEELKQKNIQEGMQGVQTTMEQVAEFVPLYQKDASARKANRMQKRFDKSAAAAGGSNTLSKTLSGIDATATEAGVADMDNWKLQDWLSEQKPEYVQSLMEKLTEKGIFKQQE